MVAASVVALELWVDSAGVASEVEVGGAASEVEAAGVTSGVEVARVTSEVEEAGVASEVETARVDAGSSGVDGSEDGSGVDDASDVVGCSVDVTSDEKDCSVVVEADSVVDVAGSAVVETSVVKGTTGVVDESCASSEAGIDVCSADDSFAILDATLRVLGDFEASLGVGASEVSLAGAEAITATGAEPPSALSAVLALLPEILAGDAAGCMDGGLGRWSPIGRKPFSSAMYL